MYFMFRNAASFDQPLNNWNVSAVTDMADMFTGADKFVQNLGSWYVTLDGTSIDRTDRPRDSRVRLGAELAA